MQITTIHTLAFTVKDATIEQHNAAVALVKGGAETMGLSVTISNLPLHEGEDHGKRHSMVKASSDDYETCEKYWAEVSRALTLIGVEATSP